MDNKQRLNELTVERDSLTDQLDEGCAAIGEARSTGKDVSTWTDFWLGLLSQYEQVCSTIKTLEPQVMLDKKIPKSAAWWDKETVAV